MVKSTIATNLDGLLIKSEAFFEPHKAWFDRAIKKTGNKDLEKWKGRKDYFLGVNEAMELLMPKATAKERTAQARSWYQEDVIKYIKENPGCVDINVANKLREIKKRYDLILITTNAIGYIHRILSVAKIDDIYRGIIASDTEQEPNKKELIERCLAFYGKPEFYLTGKDDPETTKILVDKKITLVNKKDIKLL